MSVAFALSRDGQELPVANGQVVTWMVAMFPRRQPEDKWYKIPPRLLEPHMHTATIVYH